MNPAVTHSGMSHTKRGLALLAGLVLAVASVALVAPMVVLGANASCPPGTTFLDNIEITSGGALDGSFDGLEFELKNGGLQVTNTTADQWFTIVVKGGSNNNGGGDGAPVEVGPGETVFVTAPINTRTGKPFGVSNFSICGTPPSSGDPS